jgi:ribosomal protein S18 acetylase RimI-like enzyme
MDDSTGGTSRIEIATTDEQIDRCFDAISELRPHLVRSEFLSRIRSLQASSGFRLAYLFDGSIRCVAGYRISEWLAGGRYLEIEDLVAPAATRSRGAGSQIFDWLCKTARSEYCDHIRLVSRVSREDAHRFYERKGMAKEAYYFSMQLKP